MERVSGISLLTLALLATLSRATANAQVSLLPSLESSEVDSNPNRYRFFLGAEALFWQRGAKGSGATWVRGTHGGGTARTEYKKKDFRAGFWGLFQTGRVDGPYAQSSSVGNVDADLTDRQVGGELQLFRGFGVGGELRRGQVRVSGTNSAFLPLVFLPSAPGTLSGIVPLDSHSAWVDFGLGALKVRLKREWKSDHLYGNMPYADLSGGTNIPVAAIPDLSEYALKLHTRSTDWELSSARGNRSGYMDIAGGIGLAYAEGRLRNFRLAAKKGRQQLAYTYTGFNGSASGVIFSGDSLNIGLPVASVVAYDTFVRAHEASLEYTTPLRLRHGEASLTLGHAWVSGEASGDYDANILFFEVKGKGAAKFQNRFLLARFRWELASGAMRPYISVQQVVPYAIGSHHGSGGGSGRVGLGQTYGGGSVEIGWTGPIGG